MRSIKSKFRTLALATAAIGVLSACQAPPDEAANGGADPVDTNSADTSPAGSDGALKLGSILPSTGDLASIGQNMPVAAKLAVDTVNACGGVNGQPVQLIAEDSQTDPNTGAAAMTKLAEVDRVAGVVGAFASSVSSAAVDVATRNQVMLISPGSTSPVFTQRAANGDFNGYWARTAPPDTYQAAALATLASEQGFSRVSTVVINNDYGVGFEKEFVKTFKSLGGEVVNEGSPVRYDPKATTFDSEAAAAFEGQPDAVLGVLYAETGSLLLKSAYEQGLSDGVTVMLTDGVYSEDFPKQVGQAPDGTSIISGALGTVPGAGGEALADLTQLWRDEIGTDITAFVPHSWDAAALLMLAAEAADANTGEGIQSKIREVANAPGKAVNDVCEALALLQEGEDIDYQGASSKVDLDENGDTIGSYDVWTIEASGSLDTVGSVTPGE